MFSYTHKCAGALVLRKAGSLLPTPPSGDAFFTKKIGTLDNKVKLLKFKKWWEGVTPHNGVHMGVFFVGGKRRGRKNDKRGAETGTWGQEWRRRKSGAGERER